MITISPTKARMNLTHWLKLAAQGEDIGILCGESIIALRNVSVQPVDPAFDDDYGLSARQLSKISRKLKSIARRNVSKKTSKSFKGNLHALLKD
ncbi:MAG: hypothetical protein NZM04_01730 [Methylacidiphilales bacterium]|nr:hypothetical protein [Candidatus Methylacidiphilales bacterium]